MNQWAAARIGDLHPTQSTRLVFSGAVAINILMLLAIPFLGKARLSLENGIIENAQAALLAAGFAFSTLAAYNLRHDLRIAATIMAFVCFSMFFREVDFRPFTMPTWAHALTSGPIRDGVFVFLLVCLLFFLYLNRRDFIRVFRFTVSYLSMPLYAFALLMAGAQMVDKGLVVLPDPGFWEEFLEINAYIFLFMASVRLNEYGRHLPKKYRHAAVR